MNFRIESDLNRIFKEVLENKSKTPLEDLNKVYVSIGEINAAEILAFLITLLRNEIKLSYFKSKEQFEELINNIRKKLAENLSDKLRHLIFSQEIEYSFEESVNQQNKNIFDTLTEAIFEILLKKSKHEITNSINLYFNRENPMKHSAENLIRSLLNYLKMIPSNHVTKVLKEIIYNAEDKDIEVLLDYFEQHPEHFGTFLLIGKFSKRDLIEKIYNEIYSEKRYFKKPLISALPEIDINRILPLVKDYNWEIAASLIESRPELARDFCAYFNEGLPGCQRSFFVEKITEKDAIFSEYLQDLNLSSEELIDLASKSKHMAIKYFDLVSTEEDMLALTKIYAKKEQAFIIDFIKNKECDEKIDMFIKCLTKAMRFTGELKDFIIVRYARDEKYFHSLISYLKMEEIEELLPIFYVPELSVESLLRKMFPQELIIEIIRFQDVSLGIKLISDCINSCRFEDKDWVLAMKFLESVNSPTKFHMCFLILEKKPGLKGQTITLIKRSINNQVWGSQLMIDDIIRCIEVLEEDCINVFDVMTEEEIVYILRKSSKTQKRMKNFFNNFNGKFTPLLNYVEGCLRRV